MTTYAVARAAEAASTAYQDLPIAYPDDADLRERVLRPYREHCRYLVSAETIVDTDTATVRADYRIGESCYIESTGHFNAVEFNLCYNQAAYYLIAKSVQEGLLDAFRGWTLADYWERQLSDVLIIDFHSTFQRAILDGRFSGELTFGNARVRPPRDGKAALVLIETTCRFWNEAGGRCEGTAVLALTNPPEAAIR